MLCRRPNRNKRQLENRGDRKGYDGRDDDTMEVCRRHVKRYSNGYATFARNCARFA